MRVNQPSNQIKLTNVSVVRLKKGGKRFEIACYKNKVQEWRNGVEKDLDEVLQISNVFVNVSKGEVANAEDLKKAFGKADQSKIVQEILKKGELQVGDRERAYEQENLWKELATLIAEKCVDPSTQRHYPVTIIQKAMTESGFSLKPDKTAKSQMSACVKQIQDQTKLPIQRARMRLRVTLPASADEAIREKIIQDADRVEQQTTGEQDWQAVILVDPSLFKVLNDLIQQELKGKGRIETLTMTAVATS